MGLWDTFLNRNKPLELKLEVVNNRAGLPKAPTLDTSLDSLLTYARRNELVYACIEKKAQAACDPVLVVEERQSDGSYARVQDHPLVTLWNRPNPFDDSESFLRAWIASENFADVVYAEKVRNRAGQVAQLYPLNPAYVSPQYKATESGYVLDYYEYNNGLKTVKFTEEELLVRRRHGQGSVYDGISPVAVALGAIDSDLAMTDYVRSFFNNDGVPSGQLIIKDRRLSNEEAESLQQRWSRKFGRGGAQRKGVVVLDQSAEFQKIGSNLDELASDSITSQIESRICMAFGVPPVLVGAYVGLLNVNQKASFEGAMAEFWRGTMSPELKSIRNFLNSNLLTEFEDPERVYSGAIRVNWDMTQVEALRDNVNDLHKRTREDYTAGLLTLNEARALTGLEPVAEGDAFTQAQTAPQALPAAPKSETVSHGYTVTSYAIEEPKSLPDADLQKKKFEYQGMMLSREPNANEMSVDLKGMVEDMEGIKQKIRNVLGDLRGKLIEDAAKVGRTLSEEELYSLTLTPPVGVYKKLEKILTDGLGEGAKQVLDELRKQGADSTGAVNLASLAEVAQKLTDLTVSRMVNETQTRAINAIATQLLLGISQPEAVGGLVAILSEQSDKYVDGYAGGAANAAIQEGRSEAMSENADIIGLYQYSALLDDGTCPACADADGMEAESEEDLPPTPNPDCDGGDRCRCFIVAIYAERNN